MTQHAKDFSPSASARWLTCTASVKALREAKPKDSGSSFAREGTIAHELGEMCLRKGTDAEEYRGNTFEVPVTNGADEVYLIDDEFIREVTKYVEYVRERIDFDSIVHIEERVCFDEWIPNGFGTADAIVINNDCCHVIDLKYGKGIQVDAQNNTQGMLYALGVYQQFRDSFKFSTFCIHIVQPRLNNYSTFEFSVDELVAFGEHAKAKATEALSDEATYNPTEKGCEWCPISGSCAAMAKQAYETISAEFDDVSLDDELELPNENTLSPDRVAKIVGDRKMIEKFLGKVYEHALELVETGTPVPGYKLVESRTNRSWRDADAVIELAVEQYDVGPTEVYSMKPISPTQFEKKFKRLYEQLEDDHVYKPDGKPTLVVESDKRKALTPTADEFEVLE